jgi:hypothetical protein
MVYHTYNSTFDTNYMYKNEISLPCYQFVRENVYFISKILTIENLPLVIVFFGVTFVDLTYKKIK